jgi:hypothetical protein
MYAAALLNTIEEASAAVLILTEDLQDEELLGSRLTRAEVERQLILASKAAEGLGKPFHEALPEIDWPAWLAIHQALSQPAGSPGRDEAMLFGVHSLTAATMMWLRQYKSHQPEMFRIGAA